MSFCHCHLHSEWSLLDGCGRSEDYVRRAIDIGQEAIAITDHGNLCGALYHAQACEEKDIKPIIGMEAYFEPIAGQSKAEKNRGLYHHMLLIAKSMEGFQNLMRLSSAGFQTDRFYYNPIIDWDLLSRNSTGLIATSTCVSGFLPELILGRRPGDADDALDQMLQIFGDDFFLEIQPHDFPEQHLVNKQMVAWAKERGLPLLATIDTHYPFEDWRDTQDTVIMLGTGADLKKRATAEAEILERIEAGEELSLPMRAYPTTWMMSEDEVREHFAKAGFTTAPLKKALEEAIGNTNMIAERVENFSFDRSPKVPRATKTPEEAEAIIRSWCEEGLERIGKAGDETYESRLETELSMFKKKGVFDYFVIIGDVVRWSKSTRPLPSEKEKNPFAKKRPIRVGAGRGSAAGSLVLYLIRVTGMDPIGYDLLFARFMSEARAEMPDVDIDFQHNRRDEVAQYIIEKYGKENVAYVAAFQSFGMKSVIQAVSRAHNIDFGEAKRASETLDDEAIGTELEDVVDLPGHEALAKWRDGHPKEWQIALNLEGQVKGMSKHAAAVVVTDRPVSELMPTMRVTGIKVLKGDSDEVKDKSMVTQWSARANAELIATYGFLKIDLLVTVGLTVQQECIDLIRERHGIEIDFEDPLTHPEVEKPIGEEAVCRRFGHGANLGVFQFGSGGICRALADINPSTLDHLIAANAMYRPGPIQNIGSYAKRKNGKEDWSLGDPKAEPVLGKTFGIITYQEQVMQLCIELAGMDPTQADIARKVVGKGVARDIDGKKKLEKLHKEWTEGCKKNDVDLDYAEELFQFVLEMATYSFNRAHAAGYALQAYQDQWLKEHYPIEFYTALLTWDPPKAKDTVREARALGIEVLPPDINDSWEGFRLIDNSILFGLRGIKNVGEVAADHIFSVREERPFNDLDDLESRITKGKCNSKVRGSLLDCGAFDRWGCRDDWDSEQKAERELELLGFAPSRESDLALYREFLENECVIHEPTEEYDDQKINLVGEIVGIREIRTKTGKRMAFLKLWYEGREFEAVLFEEQLEGWEEILTEGTAVLIAGTWQAERGSLRVKDMITVRDLYAKLTEEVAA